MSTDSPWFKMHPRDWLEGTRDLDLDARGAYADLLNLMFLLDGPVRDDDRWIAFQLHISVRKWRPLREQLIAAGKLRITTSGIINTRAALEIEQRAKRRRTNAENGAKNSPTNREKPEIYNNFNKNEKRTIERDARYARARQSESSEPDLIIFGDLDDDDRCSERIPMHWRQLDLEWLQAAMPRERLLDLVTWLKKLEVQHGQPAIDDALKRVRSQVEAGKVNHVRGYIERTLSQITNGPAARRQQTHCRAHS